MVRDNTTEQKEKSRARATPGRLSPGGLVPSRQQYFDLKRQYPDAILLFRLGDFYETFDDDARIVARDARITLTTKNFGRSGRAPMAGIPHHALNQYLGRLLSAGHSLAIAEQMSEPGHGLVERAVTRVLSPGTVGEASLLPAAENRYLAAILPRGDRAGLAWVDVSTGEFATTEIPSPALADELARLNPAECLLPDDIEVTNDSYPGQVQRITHWHFEAARAADLLCRQFWTHNLAPYGCADLPLAIGAAGAVVAYLERTNQALLPLLRRLRTEIADRAVGIDAATRRNLELTRSMRSNGTKGSLLGVLDVTRTAMGARTLRRFVNQPIRDLDEIIRRQAIVAALVSRARERSRLSAELSSIGDLERLLSRVTQGAATARDFLMLARALRHVSAVGAVLNESNAVALTTVASTLDPCPDVAELIERTIEELPDGACAIRTGCCDALDTARAGVGGTKQWLAGLERSERDRTGIRSLKVGYNKVFGYYLEVTRSNLSLVPDDYVRKQTIAVGERYITARLKEAESLILAADEEIAALERSTLADLGSRITTQAARLIDSAHGLCELDVFLSLAEVATRGGWVAPLLDDSEDLEIVGGRHPVVEASLAGEAFIPNNCHLDGWKRVLLLTGPNMGGKSTYLRSTALIVLLAQIGSFVPAASARVGLVDRIFTRVGAQDDLAGGASTFMVEMVETATILNQATRRSLVILDEVGRGTSTDDGTAIALAVLEDLHDRVGARSLFATHYLELTQLSDRLPALVNAHVAVLETDGRVIFLYAVRPGPADRAYGIHVARLAGLPPSVADRAEAILGDLDRDRTTAGTVECRRDSDVRSETRETGSVYQLGLDGLPPQPDPPTLLARQLRSLDLTGLTPGQAIDWLIEQKRRLDGGCRGA